MRIKLPFSLLIFALLTVLLSGTQAQAAPLQPGQITSPNAPTAPLCMPAAGPADESCQALGPAAYLSRVSSEGLTLPRSPLPAEQIDLGFASLPYNYVRLTDDDTEIYTSLDDAKAKQNPYRSIPPGFKYATYETFFEGPGGGRHYMVEPGMWIRGGDTNGRVAPAEFRGMVFYGSPTHQFGWIMRETPVRQAPGLNAQVYPNKVLYRYNVIQVYQTMEANGTTWLMVGPDEWINKTDAALVYPAAAPPEGVDNGRWIEINLYEQTISVYQNNHLVFATLTSTGIAGWWTRPGLFQIYEKLETTPMSGAFEADRSDYYYLEDVPWTMYFDEARALHGAYWHNYFGYEQSHGCVNLSPADSQWLYLWGNVGDYIYVWDPSGETPTDPTLYTAGGA